NSAEEFFGMVRLKQLLSRCAGTELCAKALGERVEAEVTGFVGDAAQFDDITLIVFRLAKYAAASSVKA
ncbi:MAG: hypothetical protein RR060_02665, partial [Victivallaceae bacterium]